MINAETVKPTRRPGVKPCQACSPDWTRAAEAPLEARVTLYSPHAQPSRYQALNPTMTAQKDSRGDPNPDADVTAVLREALLPESSVTPLEALSHARIAALQFMWLPVTATYTLITGILMPAAIQSMTSASSKGTTLGASVVIGGVIQLLGPLFAGASDRCGRRRPFVTAGMTLQCIGLAGMIPSVAEHLAVEHAAVVYIASYSIYQLFSTLAVQPYLCVVAELVPKEQRGMASGFQATMAALGTLLGAIAGLCVADGVSGSGPLIVYCILMAVNIVGMLVSASVLDGPSKHPIQTEPADPQRCCSFFSAFFGASFCWLFISASFSATSSSVVVFFLEYYFSDALHNSFSFFGHQLPSNAVEAVSIFTVVQLVPNVLSAFLGGWLSDRTACSRQRVLAAAFLLIMACNLALAFTASFTVVLFVACGSGFGAGLASAPLWALAVDSLPNSDNPARDLSLFYLYTLVPRGGLVPNVC